MNQRRLSLPRRWALGWPLLWLPALGCAHLHHVEIGEMDTSRGRGTPFEVKISDTGIDVEQGLAIAGALSGSRSFNRASKQASDVWKAITYGPKTGEVIFNDVYADEVVTRVIQACPGGEVVGLTIVRETNKYPVVSGEIVRVRGLCVRDPNAPAVPPAASPPAPASAPAPSAPTLSSLEVR